MRPRSLRLRLVAASALSIVVALAVAGISLVTLFEQQILRRVEQELAVRWTDVAAGFAVDAAGQPTLARELADPRYHRPYGGAYWQVSENGSVVLQSRSLWDARLDDAAAPVPAGDIADAFELAGPNASELYALSRQVTTGGRQFRLTVALDHAEIEALRLAFARDVAMVLLPIGAVLTLGTWLQFRLNFGPLDRLRRQLGLVSRGARRRLESDWPVELAPLAGEVNLLLDSQEAMIGKARDRAGVLAHGLKTPLSVLSAQARRLARAGNSHEAEVIAAQVEAMRVHVDRELARARTAGRTGAGGAFSPVGETVERLFRLMRHLPRGDELLFRLVGPSEAAVRMDADDLGEVLGNLLDNARLSARSAVTVRVVGLPGGRMHIAVEDDGPGFSADRLAALGERGAFDATRADSSGLGLGIVRDVLAECGCDLVVDSQEGACRVWFEIDGAAADAPARRDAAAAPVDRPASPARTVADRAAATRSARGA